MISLRCDSESTDDADDWRRKDKASTTKRYFVRKKKKRNLLWSGLFGII